MVSNLVALTNVPIPYFLDTPVILVRKCPLYFFYLTQQVSTVVPYPSLFIGYWQVVVENSNSQPSKIMYHGCCSIISIHTTQYKHILNKFSKTQSTIFNGKFLRKGFFFAKVHFSAYAWIIYSSQSRISFLSKWRSTF